MTLHFLFYSVRIFEQLFGITGGSVQDIKDKTILEKAKMLEELNDEDRKAVFRIIEIAAKQKKFAELFSEFKK